MMQIVFLYFALKICDVICSKIPEELSFVYLKYICFLNKKHFVSKGLNVLFFLRKIFESHTQLVNNFKLAAGHFLTRWE